MQPAAILIFVIYNDVYFSLILLHNYETNSIFNTWSWYIIISNYASPYKLVNENAISSINLGFYNIWQLSVISVGVSGRLSSERSINKKLIYVIAV